MGRPRFQRGHVTEISGNWRGFYYVNTVSATGQKKRPHKSVVLGQCSQMTKTDAKKKLLEIILKELPLVPDDSVTLRWFIENKWQPLKEAKWKASTKLTNTGIIKKQILEPLGDIPLGDFDKARLQLHLNALASQEFSHSIIQHTHSFLGSIFAEAEELNLIQRSPARRLEIPRAQTERILDPENAIHTGKPYLEIDQLRKFLGALEGRNRAIAMLASLCAMRPGEIFALTWKCWKDDRLFIIERVYRRKFDVPKTATSMGQIPVPEAVQKALTAWKLHCPDSGPNSFIFPGKNLKSPLDQYNYSDRVLKPAGIMAVGGAFAVTFQVLRRTFATLLPAYGGDLKAVESVLRHAASKSFTTGVYIQPMLDRIKEAMDRLANAAADGLPEKASEIPVAVGLPEPVPGIPVEEKIDGVIITNNHTASAGKDSTH